MAGDNLYKHHVGTVNLYTCLDALRARGHGSFLQRNIRTVLARATCSNLVRDDAHPGQVITNGYALPSSDVLHEISVRQEPCVYTRGLSLATYPAMIQLSTAVKITAAQFGCPIHTPLAQDAQCRTGSMKSNQIENVR